MNAEEEHSDGISVTEFHRGVVISMDRPPDNRLDYAAVETLSAHVASVSARPGTRFLALRGTDDVFCRGDAVDSMGEYPARLAYRRPAGTHPPASLPEQQLLTTLRSLNLPTVAVVDGDALGLGLDLVCACDIRLTTRSARLGDPRVGEGRLADTGITYTLPRLIGQSRAMTMLLLGDLVVGEEAARIGLTYRAVSASEIDAVFDTLAEHLSTMATRSYALIKQQILDELDMDYDTALMHSIAIRQTNVIEDRAEAIAAFREKRPPQFEGR